MSFMIQVEMDLGLACPADRHNLMQFTQYSSLLNINDDLSTGNVSMMMRILIMGNVVKIRALELILKCVLILREPPLLLNVLTLYFIVHVIRGS